VLVLAGVTDGDAAALDQNRAIALRVCEAAARAGARHLLFASSAAVYGSTGDRAAGESAVPRPQGAYGASKLEMERAVMAWRAAAGAQAPQVTVLRIGNVAGADAVTRLASRGGRQALDRFAGGDGPVRSYIGPRTLAAVIAALAVRALAGAPLPVVLNVASPGAVALAELMRASGIAFDWRPAPPAAIARVVLDTAALEALVPLAPADPAAMVAEARLLAGTPA
jgi:nucleoside-diphosphate-sugar epimerase